MPCGPGQHLTLPLPGTTGQVQLEFARPEPIDDNPTQIVLHHHPNQPGPSEARRWLLRESSGTCEVPVTGGLLEIVASAPVVCRRAWFVPQQQPDASGWELTEEQRPLRVSGSARSAAGILHHPVAWPAHAVLPIPATAVDRSPAAGGTGPSAPLEAATVEYRLLDAQGQVLRQGLLTTRPERSLYDRSAGNLLDGAVSDPASYYFALAPAVCRVQLRAADDSVAIVAFTRPPDLVRTCAFPKI